MAERPFVEQIILDEIGGKNNAIHAYDHMLWTVRSGFLTLFFVGWGFLLKGLLDQQHPGTVDEAVTRVMTPMLLVSLGLSVGGFIIDMNYIRRKFRVINALNGFLSMLLGLAKPDKNINIDEKQLKDLSTFTAITRVRIPLGTPIITRKNQRMYSVGSFFLSQREMTNISVSEILHPLKHQLQSTPVTGTNPLNCRCKFI